MDKTLYFPALVRQARLDAGFKTQEEAASRLNVNIKTVSRVESGASSSPEILQKMAELYGVSWLHFLREPASTQLSTTQ